MRVRVVESGPETVRIEAPLGPNRNHHTTAFGGSVAALAILAGWALVHTRLEHEGAGTSVVIQESSIRYEAPIASAFTAVCEAPEPAAWARFARTLSRWGRARIRLPVHVESEGRLVARAEGSYVALARAGDGG